MKNIKTRKPMPKWGKYLLRATSFVLIFAVLFVLVSYLLRPEDSYVKEVFSGFYAEPDDSLDVVAYGGSGVFRYFITPEIWKSTGLTSYLLTSSNQPFETISTLMTETRKSQNPKLFIVEIRRLVVNDYNIKKNISNANQEAHLRLVTDNMVYSTTRNQLIDDQVDGNKLDWYIDLIHNHSNWKNLTLKSFGLMLYHKINVMKGSYISSNWTKQQEFDIDSYKNQTVTLETDTTQKLQSLLNYCQSNQLNVLFVSTPYVENELTFQEENSIGAIIRQYGYSYLNMNEFYQDIGLDFSQDYYDTRHVNVSGAMKVTKYFVN